MKELEEIDDYICSVLVFLLLKMVPEYKGVFEQSYSEKKMPDQGVYLFMNEFTTCLSEELLKNYSSSFVTNAFIFINKVGDSNNLELLNIVRVGILEILYTSKELDRAQICSMLNEKLKKYFNEFSKYYN